MDSQLYMLYKSRKTTKEDSQALTKLKLCLKISPKSKSIWHVKLKSSIQFVYMTVKEDKSIAAAKPDLTLFMTTKLLEGRFFFSLLAAEVRIFMGNTHTCINYRLQHFTVLIFFYLKLKRLSSIQSLYMIVKQDKSIATAKPDLTLLKTNYILEVRIFMGHTHTCINIL